MPKLWINDTAGGHRNTVKAVFDAFKPAGWTTVEHALLPWASFDNTPSVLLSYAQANAVDLVVVPYGAASDYAAWDLLVQNGIGVVVPHYSNDAFQWNTPTRLHSAVLIGGGVSNNIRSFGPAMEFFAEATNLTGDNRTLTSFTSPYIAAALAHLLDAGLNYWEARLSLRDGRAHTFQNGFGKVTLPVSPQPITDIGAPTAVRISVNRNNLARMRWVSFRQPGFEATRIEKENGQLVYEGSGDSAEWQIDQPNGDFRLIWKTRVNGQYSTPRLYGTGGLGDASALQFRAQQTSQLEYTGLYNSGLTTAPDKVSEFNSYSLYSLSWNYSRGDVFQVEAATDQNFSNAISFNALDPGWNFTTLGSENPPLVMQPNVTYYVRVRATNAFGTGAWSDTVVMFGGLITGYIVPEPPPVILPSGTLSLSQTTLEHPGGQVVLSWTSADTVTASLSGIGAVGPSGSQSVSITETTTFTLTLTNANGSTSYTATVTVLPAPPPPPPPAPSGTFTTSPMQVPYPSGSVMLSWSSSGATSATLNGEPVGISGSQVVSISQNTVFTLVLAGLGGQTVLVADVSVAAPGFTDNIFDRLKFSTFDVVARTLGYDLYWNGQYARVLLRRPTEQEALGNINFDPRMSVFEFKEADLPGLFQAVREHEVETVQINNRTYIVRDIQAIFDGETYLAQIVEQV